MSGLHVAAQVCSVAGLYACLVGAADIWRCAACGGENPADTKFCGHCGAPAEEIPATAATEPPAYDTGAASALRSFVTGSVADRLVETGGQLPEERRLVTALFADVSGFTALADRLDPEELIEVIDPVITTLGDVSAGTTDTSRSTPATRYSRCSGPR